MPNEAHVRIDEGVKRGPRNQRISTPRKRAPNGQILKAMPEGLDPQEVLARYLIAETTSSIASEYGCSRKTLVAWLRNKAPEQWKHVQIIRALEKKEVGDELIESAEDALSLARARELLKSGQWDLERLDAKNYGQKQEVTVKTEERIELILEGDVQALIERVRPNGVVSHPHCTALVEQLPSVADNSYVTP